MLYPEALISIPLIARAQIKGVLNIYRVGDDGSFTEGEFEFAKRFADAAALALDNAQIRARLEHQAQTDPLTGLFNHRSFHERLLDALQDASATHGPVAVLMLDIDDFKRVNDVHGHGVGDELLRTFADTLRGCVRPDDVVCRLGGDEFGRDHALLRRRRCDADRRPARRAPAGARLPGVGSLTVSIGISLGPEHAMNPRELTACAEVGMMTAKSRGKNRIVLYDDASTERPRAAPRARRALDRAHEDAAEPERKLNRLNDVRQIGDEIAAELRSLIAYHNCRVFVVDGEELVPVAFRGEFVGDTSALPLELLRTKIGSGITGRCRRARRVAADRRRCELRIRARASPGRRSIEESLLAVPMRYGVRVVGVIVVSKLGLDQFDEDDVRLLEVLAGHAAVAVENASLYESARREAESATALLEFGRELATSSSLEDVLERVVDRDGCAARLAANVLLDGGHRRLARRRACFTAIPPRSVPAWSRAASRPRRPGVSPAASRSCSARTNGSAIDGKPLDPTASYAIAPLLVDGRIGCIAAALPDGNFGERELRLLGGLAHQAKLAIANASNYEGLERTFVETVEALSSALEANDEYTSTHARWITDLALRVGERVRAWQARTEAARARRTSPRRRQDRNSERHSLEARPAHRRGARSDRDPSGARRADHRADRPPPGGAHDRAALPRALGRARLSGRARRRRHPARVADHPRLRRLPRDDDRPAVSQAPEPPRGRAPPP